MDNSRLGNNRLKEGSLRMPDAEPNGFVPTLNGLGFMSSYLDAVMREFVSFSANCDLPVVDIGAAYGVATIPTLETGALVFAVDSSEKHLSILQQRTPISLRRQLKTLAREFPSELSFESCSVGAILIARVLHFFDPAKLEHATSLLYDWLTPGGKVFVTSETPYLGNWKSFIPVYEARRKRGDPWPGYVHNVMEFALARGENLPPTMLLLDPDVIKRVFCERGFILEKCDFLARPEFPDDMRLDGRESVGAIFRKPSNLINS